MKFLQLTTLASVALALPSDLSSRQTCTSPKLRKSWSKATTAEKTAYLNAAVCVTKKASKLGINANAKLHDDFAYVHAVLSRSPQKSERSFPILPLGNPLKTPNLYLHANLVHQFAGFLPWHRFFVHVYENALKDCGYTGTAMYWDWVADSAAPQNSVVWDAVTGFGGNGVSDGTNGPRKRVTNGPFKDYKPQYWNDEVSSHWLSRDWMPADAENSGIAINGDDYTAAKVAEATALTSYDAFRAKLEDGPHAAVHLGVGGGGRGLGDMGTQNASPNGTSKPPFPSPEYGRER